MEREGNPELAGFRGLPHLPSPPCFFLLPLGFGADSAFPRMAPSLRTLDSLSLACSLSVRRRAPLPHRAATLTEPTGRLPTPLFLMGLLPCWRGVWRDLPVPGVAAGRHSVPASCCTVCGQGPQPCSSLSICSKAGRVSVWLWPLLLCFSSKSLTV